MPPDKKLRLDPDSHALDTPRKKMCIPKAHRIKHALSTTSHVVVQTAAVYRCSRCFSKVSLQGDGAEQWLQTPCMPNVAPDWVHISHAYTFRPVALLYKVRLQGKPKGCWLTLALSKTGKVWASQLRSLP